MTNKLYTCLWFDGQAQEAARFYCSIFRNSKITADNQMVVKKMKKFDIKTLEDA